MKKTLTSFSVASLILKLVANVRSRLDSLRGRSLMGRERERGGGGAGGLGSARSEHGKRLESDQSLHAKTNKNGIRLPSAMLPKNLNKQDVLSLSSD